MITLNIDPANKQTAYVLVVSRDNTILDKGIIPNDKMIKLATELYYEVLNIEIVANMGLSGVSLYDTSEMVGILCYIANKRGATVNRFKRHTVKKLFQLRNRHKVNGVWVKVPSSDSQIRSKLIEMYGEVGTKANQGYFYGFKADIWQAMAIYHTYKNNGQTSGSYLFGGIEDDN